MADTAGLSLRRVTARSGAQRRRLTALDDVTAVSLDILPPADAAALLVRLSGRAGLSPGDPGVREITGSAESSPRRPVAIRRPWRRRARSAVPGTRHTRWPGLAAVPWLTASARGGGAAPGSAGIFARIEAAEGPGLLAELQALGGAEKPRFVQ